ncbi:monofunctional biosynthetic peptidoglycan transglycosylase [uncultured Mucilaginibacter sp.]|uniref:monofunctional biosynthetic peptidoglycan transglycosylase n=1 Tax=uncultured Mucilaginibacter sp. TaxID=797541 RepID=UPI0026362BBF|nr:monofunctional biosynthetic peptidoglycan transglycosylase [uncultured Mucilaginibacter sp.]
MRLFKYLLKLILIGFFGVTILWVLLLRFINPPVTLLMIERGFERKAAGKNWKIDKDWVSFDDMSINIKKAAVASEDQLFLEHHGFDLRAIERAIDKNQHSNKLIGGSTISQQTAKNVFLWPGRSYIRKAFEAYFTMLIEALWSKERIMEVYLNVIEMGDGIYGIEAASETYFKRHASELNKQQSALIVGVWPNPLKWSPVKPTQYIRHRSYLIMKNMRRLGPLDF